MNSTIAKDDMAQHSAPSSPSSLTLRMISAAVMMPVIFGAVWLGGWFFIVLTALIAGLMYWEWQGLCGERGNKANLFALFCATGPVVLAITGGPQTLIGWGLMTVVIFILQKYKPREFLAIGFAYIYLACISLVWLRGLDQAGMETMIWLGIVVVMTDTCAYFTGRSLGGPKLAPAISPKKTWSGLIGGIVGAAVAGAILAGYIGANIVGVAVVSGVFAIIAQIGDLAISKAKRMYDVKDSSNIIPGHGGVLDRFDGILAAALAMALLTLLGGGSPLSWL